ncbi:AlbA family DNA-binding domain-containing protein [Streptomyces colonosanans]|uniref:AlbA family DNA-binding domain-containing protein n=1 Tax=Streptomyces colonosanans TaxID=1428652 RepID=UPI000D1AC787|nr:ATP-binding protein [Streptomyces colonosanans]
MSTKKKTVVFRPQGEFLATTVRDWPIMETVDGFIGHERDLVHVKAVDLKAALRSYRKYMWGEDAEGSMDLAVTNINDEYFDDEAPPGGIRFSLRQDDLILELEFWSMEYLDEDEEPEVVDAYIRALGPYLKRAKTEFLGWERSHDYPASPFLIKINLRPPTRGKTLKEIYGIGEGAIALLAALQGATLTRETTLNLLRAGNASVLIGQPEGPWLDVKSDHYNLKSASGKISLAQAVARFANAEHGGIVVVGMRGKKVPGGEEIRGICPVPLDKGVLRAYQYAVEHHLYPPPDYLDIESVEIDGGMLVLIHVPPQPEELKPFLVHGAIVEGSVEGAFISIIRRRGESSIPITAPAIHATLAAGRALLRRGNVDNGDNAKGS